MEILKHKRVELTELFYDLVYVYAISQVTTLIHHGNLQTATVFEFLVGMIIYVNSWMVQSVFTNRFGKNSLINISSMFLQMVLLLISSTAITSNWNTHFYQFILPMVGISFILLGQYISEYLKKDNEINRSVIKPFFYIMGLRTAILFLSAFIPYKFGLGVATSGILLTWILPGLLIKSTEKKSTKSVVPINFPHLIERLSLLIIITFGEMIIDIAPTFKAEHLSIVSFIIFFAVVNLFMIYIVELDHLINLQQIRETGNRAIYAHYLILFGLSFITVCLGEIGISKIITAITIYILYGGLALFVTGVVLHNYYNKSTHRLNRTLYVLEYATLIISMILSSQLLSQLSVSFLFFVTTSIIAFIMIVFNIKKS
ncbi:low temperature requirement protein A [Lactococcus lactis]|uniref:low temperature requirement protein A n=1 Tax=Lactococcus lactis TaxID=1358 RepID=UPI00190FF1FD|nr:low temperature requirement protein A [Lactococcus lactis]MCT1191674.1 low temperature requirement protein A [Lactococcus lactis]QQE99116.1 low temperature requirement protein A [Lactococcus lactis]UCS89263.1 low temperature requirement protein A [Lactococcus lactis]